MSKPSMEKLEQGVSALIEVFHRLKDENKKLKWQVKGFKREYESLEKEKDFIKEKLEKLSKLEIENRNNENDQKEIRQMVVDLLDKLEKFELT